MFGNVRSISAESFKEGEAILNEKYNKYEIINVETKRKWFFGPMRCEISYIGMSPRIEKEPYGHKRKSDKTSLDAKKYTDNETGVTEERFEDFTNEMKDLFQSLIEEVDTALKKGEKNSSDALTQVENALIKNGVTKEISEEIIKGVTNRLPKDQKVSSRNTIIETLREVLEVSINTCEGYNLSAVKTIMLVGPTGVGKTTTLAKLAKILFLKENEVGMITLDKYRMAASQQLKEYGDILGYEVESCSDSDELKLALLKFMDKDSILIDTTGKSQKQIVVDENLKSMVDLVNPDQLSLVLSATTKTEDLYDCIDKFSVLDVNSIIITKIDETNTLGGIINIAYKYPAMKIAYFTNGQDVSKDIENAQSNTIFNSLIEME